MQVSLREINAETVRQIVDLAVHPQQQGFVAPNAVSLAQALFSEEAWYRAIYVDDTPAGFVMLFDETRRAVPPAVPQLGLWRFMIAAPFQGTGVGAAALQQVITWARERAVFEVLQTSYVPGPGCPEPFYLKAGFHHTGRMDEDEIVLEYPLKEATTA
ncbi:GNAT family N-acetyltransferase [Chitinimonas naiadis]